MKNLGVAGFGRPINLLVYCSKCYDRYVPGTQEATHIGGKTIVRCVCCDAKFAIVVETTTLPDDICEHGNSVPCGDCGCGT